MSLADALSRVKTEHDVAIARLREENIALHRRVADVESRMQAIMASVMSGRGPTARS